MSLRPTSAITRAVVGVPVPTPPPTNRLAAVLAVGMKTPQAPADTGVQDTPKAQPNPRSETIGPPDGPPPLPRGSSRARVEPSEASRFVRPELERLREEVARLQRALADVNGQLTACLTSEDLIKSQLEDIRQEHDARFASYLELAEKAETNEEVIKALKKAKAELEERNAKEQSLLQSDFLELEGQFRDAEEARAQTEADLGEAKANVEVAREKIDALVAEKNEASETASAEFFELSTKLLEAERSLEKAQNTLRAARAESAAAEVEMDRIREEARQVRSQFAAMQARIEALEAQVQSERQSARGQDELVALRADVDDLRKGIAAANPENYAKQLTFAIQRVDPEEVKRLLRFGATYQMMPDKRAVHHAFLALFNLPESGPLEDYDPQKAIEIMNILAAAGQKPTEEFLMSYAGNGRNWQNYQRRGKDDRSYMSFGVAWFRKWALSDALEHALRIRFLPDMFVEGMIGGYGPEGSQAKNIFQPRFIVDFGKHTSADIVQFLNEYLEMIKTRIPELIAAGLRIRVEHDDPELRKQGILKYQMMVQPFEDFLDRLVKADGSENGYTYQELRAKGAILEPARGVIKEIDSFMKEVGIVLFNRPEWR